MTSFALITPLLIFATFMILQIIFILITYVTLSITSDRAARWITMGFTDSQVIRETKLEVDKYTYFTKEVNLAIDRQVVGQLNLKTVTVSADYVLPMGYSFRIKTSSYAQ